MQIESHSDLPTWNDFHWSYIRNAILSNGPQSSSDCTFSFWRFSFWLFFEPYRPAYISS